MILKKCVYTLHNRRSFSVQVHFCVSLVAESLGPNDYSKTERSCDLKLLSAKKDISSLRWEYLSGAYFPVFGPYFASITRCGDHKGTTIASPLCILRGGGICARPAAFHRAELLKQTRGKEKPPRSIWLVYA